MGQKLSGEEGIKSIYKTKLKGTSFFLESFSRIKKYSLRIIMILTKKNVTELLNGRWKWDLMSMRKNP